MLIHDFGIVRPGDTQTCVFRILNASEQKWTLDHIQRACTCTVIDASEKEVMPGASSDVTVSYHAPDKAADDERNLTVFFRDADVADAPEAAQVRLVVKATVRPVLTLFPADLMSVELLPGKAADRAVMVYNFGDDDWDDLVVSHDAKWVSTTIARTSVEGGAISGRPQPRQAWRVGVTARSDDLAIGDYSANLRFSPGNTGKDQVDLPIILRIPAPVRAIPDRLFFGYIGKDEAVERIVIIALSDGASKVESGDIQLKSSLESRVSFSWDQRHGRFRHLKVRFDPTGQSGRIDGTISVAIPGILSGSLEIRVSAVISQPAVIGQANASSSPVLP